MAWSNREKLTNNVDRIHVISGAFPISNPGVAASLTWTHVTGTNATITYDDIGTTGNSFYFTANTSTTVACSKVCATTNNNCTLVVFGEINWVYNILPHGITGGGCTVREDTTNRRLFVSFETGVTTMTQMKTAINSTCTKVRAYGGSRTTAMTTAADLIYNTAIDSPAGFWPTADCSTSVVLSVVATTTIASIAAFINDATLATGKVTITYTSGVCDTAKTKTALSGGVAAVTLNSSYKTGKDYSVARTGAYGTHSYTVTFDDSYATQGELFCVTTGVKCTTAAVQTGMVVIPGAYDSSNKTLVLYLSDGDSSNAIASDTDVTPSTDSTLISFRAEFRVKG